MSLLIGLDPGGEKSFGWCVSEYSSNMPLQVVCKGTVDNSCAAVKIVREEVGDKKVSGVGIDAPLYWTSSKQRKVDSALRDSLKQL